VKFMKKIGLILLAAFVFISSSAHAVPQGNFTNIFERVAWNEIFPMKIGGATVRGSSGNYDVEDKTTDTICVCDLGVVEQIGVTTSFWEPARMIETVKDPYYSPFFGTELPMSDTEAAGFLGGAQSSLVEGDADSSFSQAHYFIFPVMKMLELMVGMTCGEIAPFDMAYLSELDPTWNDDLLAMMSMPDALLFSNPYAIMACMADTVAASFDYPLDPMFWCLGYDTTYPLTGSTTNVNLTASNFTLAGRALFSQARRLQLHDAALDECMNVPFPILWKSHYKLQLAKPVKANKAYPLGTMQFLWANGKNPIWNSALNFSSGNAGEASPESAGTDTEYSRPATETGGEAVATGDHIGTDGESSDNFLWFVFRKQLCCYL
jgi:conjugal transfer pilus assembly protein TraU